MKRQLVSLGLFALLIIASTIAATGQGLSLNFRGNYKHARGSASGLNCGGYVRLYASVGDMRTADWPVLGNNPPSTGNKATQVYLDYNLSNYSSGMNEQFAGELPQNSIKHSRGPGGVRLLVDTSLLNPIDGFRIGYGVLIDMEWNPDGFSTEEEKAQSVFDGPFYIRRQSYDIVTQSATMKGTIQGAGLGVCQITGGSGIVGDQRIHYLQFLPKPAKQ